jgi:hypothetical protein
VASVVATATIIAFFAVGQPWGTFNDFSYGIMTLVMLPVLVALRPIHRRSSSGFAWPAWALGVFTVLGFSIISFLETAKDVGLISFGSLEPFPGLGPFALAVLFFPLFEIWLFALGVVLKGIGVKNAIKMSVIAITSVGYPIWAVWLARQHLI